MAATIKPSDPNRPNTDGEIGFSPGGSLDAKAQSLTEFIQFSFDFGAYNVDQRIIGGPRWISTAKFDVNAKCDEATADEFRTLSLKKQLQREQAMVQALLADRFKLRFHHELRTLPVYDLIAAKGGPKLKPSQSANSDEPNFIDGTPGNWKSDGVTMETLADQLSALPEIGKRIIVDKTGLKGKFNFEMQWTPDATLGGGLAAPEYGPKADPSFPSLLTALQEQLGLKLAPAKDPVDVIVIDYAQQPSPN